MPIPDRLKLKPVDKTRLKQMSELCDQIERELEAGESAEDLLNQWHAYASRRCEPYEFRTYWKSISKETFVAEALNPPPSLDQNATYAEALAVLEAVSAAALPEAETGYYLGWLETQFPDANMNDLIFWPDEWFDDASLIRDAGGKFKPEADLSNDQILAYAMARSGRTLPGAPPDVVLPFPLPGQK